MTAGRPPFYKTPEALQKKIESYFAALPTKTVVVGAEPVEVPAATITGLALHLGFESRQSFYDYEKKDKFAYTIKRAHLLIENEYEMALLVGRSPAGPIFALKNMGWTDRPPEDRPADEGLAEALSKLADKLPG